jgi:hypothetical protein
MICLYILEVGRYKVWFLFVFRRRMIDYMLTMQTNDPNARQQVLNNV